ncbi:hypothetical protein [Hymenobacter sp.]|uniref:hypothetical protein n=1 Tax=Hymenobacter sp. TaxID=1898978 RepID=UPI00286BC390|nr:hypothetical protein [Hymenobacter sp.]
MNTRHVPNLSEQEVITIAQQALREQQWSYDPEFGLQPSWRGTSKDVLGQEGKEVVLWSVNFLTPAGPFEQESRFVEINDETRVAIGIMTGHNYFFLERKHG